MRLYAILKITHLIIMVKTNTKIYMNSTDGFKVDSVKLLYIQKWKMKMLICMVVALKKKKCNK